MTDYELEEEINHYYNLIWQRGLSLSNDDEIETYRALVLEHEYRDQNKPKATIVAIK